MDRRASKIDIRWIQVLSRGKPAFLVEFVVVRQVGLWDDAQNGTALNDCGTIEQESARLYG